jgi:hypothetical protein
MSLLVRTRVAGCCLVACALTTACARPASRPATPAQDAEVTRRGTIEVTAKLAEVPEGAIFKRELYNYATVLKYQVIEVHRGRVEGETIYVGHYNPFKPRAEAADSRVQGIGGDLKSFRAGEVHRMALEESIDDQYMGGIVDKYFGKKSDPIYWAVWTNLVGG